MVSPEVTLTPQPHCRPCAQGGLPKEAVLSTNSPHREAGELVGNSVQCEQESLSELQS